MQREYPSLVSDFKSASTELLGALLDQSADCIKVIGPAGTLDFMNRNGRCAMEIDEFDLVAGKLWWDLWPEQTRHLVIDSFERAHAGKSTEFEAFCPTAKGTPRHWEVSVSPVRDEKGELQALMSVSRDVTDKVRAREIREAASDEMRHRLQNAYTLSGAIVATSARGNSDREIFAAEVLEKLRRLGIAQSLLLDAAHLERASLDDLVRKLTDPFLTPAYSIAIEPLPTLSLDDQQVRALALIFGELSTNSNKYGAMGHGGSIAVRGCHVGNVVTLHWSETSAAPVEARERDGGNGFKLINRTIASLGGSFDIAWRSDGLEVSIQLPVKPA